MTELMAPELALSGQNFTRLAALIQQSCGIKMPAGKQTMLSLRLRPRLAALGLATLDEYCRYLFEQGGLESELVPLINAVSTNKTDFFREPVHFDFLRETVLPELMQAGQRLGKFWSSASSIGAEAYTLAMVLDDARQHLAGPDYKILGTDISTDVLAMAQAGRYPAAMVEPVPAALRKRYVLRAREPRRDEVRIVPQLRSKIAWARMNLMDETYGADRDFDMIFCRNVLIYFDRETQHRVLTQLVRHLRPGGYLVLGHSEPGAADQLGLRAVMNTIFQKGR
jgi:chemotaxis protein methyltransferase CheR